MTTREKRGEGVRQMIQNDSIVPPIGTDSLNLIQRKQDYSTTYPNLGL